jgi:hypothetical protein
MEEGVLTLYCHRSKTMDKCIYCGAETKLRINNIPVCTACAKELDAGRKPPFRQTPNEGSGSQQAS